MSVTVEPLAVQAGMNLTPSQHQELVDKSTVLARVEIHSLSFRRKIPHEDPNISVGDANRKWVSHTKAILKGEEVEAIHSQESRIRKWLGARSFSAHLESGCYLVPLSLVERIDGQLKQFKALRQDLVTNLVAVYDQRIADSKKELGALWDPDQYPSSQELLESFGMDWRFRSALEVNQNIGEVSHALLEEQMNKRLQEVVTLSQTAEAAFYEQLHSLVKHLVDVLGRYDDGTPRQFRNTAVENLREFVGLVRDMNVWGNVTIEELGQKVEKLLDGTNASDLRKPSEKRELIRVEMGKVAHQLSGLLVESGGRKFKSLK